MAVSNPSSERYGMHWSEEDVRDYFKPSEVSRGGVMRWLEGEGYVGKDVSGGGWVEVKMSVGDAERVSFLSNVRLRCLMACCFSCSRLIIMYMSIRLVLVISVCETYSYFKC